MTEFNNTQLQTKLKVLLIGETCTDKYEFCKVLKFSSEAPVPVVEKTRYYEKLGMAANVKLNLQKLGIDPDFITCTERISKTRFVDEKSFQQLLRVDYDVNTALWTGTTDKPLSEYDAILISDYNKGFLDYTAIENIITESTGLVFIDTKKTDLRRFYSDRVFVKINELEYKNATSKPLHLVVTRGNKGTQYYYDRKQIYPAFTVKEQELVDVCGAGDTFLAAFSYQYLITKNIEDAIIFANKAASITVQHLGNYAPSLKEIANA